MKLVIRHLGAEDTPDRFRVENPGNMKTTESVELVHPDLLQVEGRPNSNLLQDLRWYLEDFLTYPFEPNTEIADRVQKTLKSWGEQTFSTLFSRRGRDWYQDARRGEGGLASLTVVIASDDPRILAWPWEALRDPEGGTLAHSCCIERQLNQLHDPLPLPRDLARDRINILLIIARPFGETDVGYHALSRPLVELSRNETLPVHIDVLRPPTFDALREKLRSQPDHYHIVHFDGHGGYGEMNYSGSAYTLQGPTGHLYFETVEGEENTVTAEQLTQLLSEYSIPVMVLNACQSARIDAKAEDPFASVAAALMKAGIRSVVAMGYSLYVSGAQHFVPAFYKRLFSSGSVAEAARSGRQAMRAGPNRACLRGEFELQDWLVPVVYGQEPLPLTFEPQSAGAGQPARQVIELPREAGEMGDYGFIGRERAILDLERALRLQPQAGLLVHGMAGIGKTTLVQGFLIWLNETNGLQYPPLWFRFDDIRSAGFVINRLMSAFFETSALAEPMDRKIEALIQVLSNHPFLLVWDNFESAAGIDGTEVTAHLPMADRELLAKLLSGLRGGRTKVLITSRSPEKWLNVQTCFRLPLGGLSGEECWQYCNAVVRDLGLTLDRSDPVYAQLMELLGGHPLAMRAILLRLSEKDAAGLKKELEEGFAGAEGDESTRRIDAALHVLTAAFPPKFALPLQFIGLHQRYLVIDLIEIMSKVAEATIDQDTLRTVFTALENAGQLHHLGQGIYSMHPALSGFLRRQYKASEPVRHGFADIMARLADSLAAKELHEQRVPFAIHGGNFNYALALARQSNSVQDIAALSQSLAAYYQNNRDYVSAQRLFAELAEHRLQQGNREGEAAAYHQLGMIAEEQRDFKAAESWYKKALEIFEKQGNEHGAATTYHQLGMIAEEQRDFEAAESWYKKALAIDEKQGNEHGAASTYHQLGMIAQKQREFKAAENWYKKSLAIKEKQGNEHGAASTYHQLGRIAQEQRDFKTAETWYKKALAIFEKQGNEHGAATTYHQLGRIAEEQRDFKAAETWYKKSLAIKEKQGNEHGAATTYHQLGMIAEEQRDFEAAESWYKKALAIREKQGNEHGAAITYGQLGLMALSQGMHGMAGQWLIKAACAFLATGDQHSVDKTFRNYIDLLRQAPSDLRPELIAEWNQSNLPEMPAWEKLEDMTHDE